MTKKISILFLVICLASLAVVPAALAGATFDIGNIPGYPPAGTINWVAWHSGSILAGGYPNQIMTEDSTNSSLGTDQGYSLFGTVVRWSLIVSNYNNPAAIGGVSVVTVLLGGKGVYSGSMWSDSFTWITNAGSTTDQGAAEPFAGTGGCPSITSVNVAGAQQTFTWNGPAGKYHIYRSLNASGANNDASNGRFLYLATTNTDGSGNGTWTDTYDGQAWYTVIHAASSGAIDGCHSEEATPTAATLTDLNAIPQLAVPSVQLNWTTLSEIDLVGFNIYRSKDPGGERQKLNLDLLPPKHPGQMLGDHYTYEDLDVLPGQSYFYWVEAEKQLGAPETIGPQMANLGMLIYLPVVSR